jgi:transposase
MNKLDVRTQESVIASLVEGVSIRSIERMTGVHRDTIVRVHGTLKGTPAMAAGVTGRPWSTYDLLRLADW